MRLDRSAAPPTQTHGVAGLLRRHRALVPVLTLLLLPFIVLGYAFLPGRVMSPADNVFGLQPWSAMHPGVSGKNPLLVDITLMFHPFAMYAGDEIRAGRFPLWNPHAFGGVPFFANPQTALLFPLTALVYVLPYALALTLMSVLKLSVAGLGMYAFLRSLALSRWAAFIGALTFAFNALLITWLQWSYASAFALLPMLFAATELVRQRRGMRPVAALALAVALALFAGYPQRVVFWLFVLGTWVVYRAVRMTDWFSFAARWAAATALGVALAAVQLLPFAEYLRTSAVLAYRTEWMLYFPLPFRTVIATVMPHFFGSPPGKDFWGPVNFNEISVSVGVVPWLLLPVAVLVAWSSAGTRYFVTVAALSAVLVYGVPLLGSALASLPVLNTSIAVRNADLLVFSLTVLAGIALHALSDLSPAARRTASIAVRIAFTALMVAALGFVVGYYAIAALRPMVLGLPAQYLWLLALSTIATLAILRLSNGSSGGTRAWPILAAVQLATLLPLAITYNPVVDARLLDHRPPPVVKHLQARTSQDGGRISFSGIGAANFGTMFNLFEVGGYDGMTPRYVEQLADPVGSLESYASGPLRVTLDAASPVVDVLGIRYIVASPTETTAPPHFTVDYRGPDAVAYRNEHALPRAFLVFRTRTCLDDAAALALIENGGVDLRHEVILAGCRDAPTPGTPSARAEATVTHASADRVVIDAVADAASYLVLSDAWFPGWRAWVDGSEQTVWRANHALRAVWLPAGRHAVEFRYVPAPFRWGLVASALAAVAVLGLLCAPRRLAPWLALVVVVSIPSAADAALTAAPIDLDVTPSVLTEGERMTMTLRPPAGERQRAPSTFDIYLSFTSESAAKRGWFFLNSSGQLAMEPAPFRTSVGTAEGESFSATLRGLPPGWYLVRAQFVKSGTAAARKHYTYQPRWATIRVDPRSPDHAKLASVVGGLGAATLAGLVLVWLPGRPWQRSAYLAPSPRLENTAD